MSAVSKPPRYNQLRSDLQMRILLVEDEPDAARMIAKGLREQTYEYALLEYLAGRGGEVVGRAEIAEHVWDESYEPFSNEIEVHVRRLHQKLDDVGSESLIRTRRGEGYGVVLPREDRL